MKNNEKVRYYFLDWIKVISFMYLIIYHIALTFLSNSRYEYLFIESSKHLPLLWDILNIFNVTRTPLLFFVAGLVAYFSLKSRNIFGFLKERSIRILIPFLFGIAVLVPIHVYIFHLYYNLSYSYYFSLGHLWFLRNILIYVIIFLPLLIILNKNKNHKIILNIKEKIIKYPFLIYLFFIPIIIESLFIPQNMFYGFFAINIHGLILGGLLYFLGHIIIIFGNDVWESISKLRYFSIVIGFILYLNRVINYDLLPPHYLTSIEITFWIIGLFGIFYKNLNKKSKVLSYLSEASYPIYINHMIFLYLGAYYIIPLDLNPWISLIILALFNYTCCFLAFEITKKSNILRLLFGLKMIKKTKTNK